MLAARFEDPDILGQWMAHHLAMLVVAAQDDSSTTIEQRQQIIDTILKIWSHRWHFPRPGPLEEFKSVIIALDRLGDDSPWRFSRLFREEPDTVVPSAPNLPLVATATKLEGIARKTVMRLIWLAAQDAQHKNQEWLEVARQIESNLEVNVTAILEQIQHSYGFRAFAIGGSDEDDTEMPVGNIGAESEDEAAVEGVTADVMSNGVIECDIESDAIGPGDGDAEEDVADDPVSNLSHAKCLREMAEVLNRIADNLSADRQLNSARSVPPDAPYNGDVN